MRADKLRPEAVIIDDPVSECARRALIKFRYHDRLVETLERCAEEIERSCVSDASDALAGAARDLILEIKAQLKFADPVVSLGGDASFATGEGTL